MSRELNLLPKKYGQVGKTDNKKNYTIAVIVGIVFIVAASFGYVYIKEYYLKNKKEDLQIELDSKKAIIDANRDLDEKMNLLGKHIAMANSLKAIKEKDTKALLDEFLNEVKQYGNVKLNLDYTNTGLYKDQGEIAINAIADSIEDINKIWANLRENKKFQVSHIENYGQDGKSTRYKFSAVIKVDGNRGKTGGDSNVKN